LLLWLFGIRCCNWLVCYLVYHVKTLSVPACPNQIYYQCYLGALFSQCMYFCISHFGVPPWKYNLYLLFCLGRPDEIISLFLDKTEQAVLLHDNEGNWKRCFHVNIVVKCSGVWLFAIYHICIRHMNWLCDTMSWPTVSDRKMAESSYLQLFLNSRLVIKCKVRQEIM
jgi:hypothetical protein